MRIATPEIARIHAHICGDGNVNYYKSKRYWKDLINRRKEYFLEWNVEYTNTSPQFIDEFRKDVFAAFNRKTYYNERNHKVKIHCAKHIIQKLEVDRKNSYTWFVPSFILQSQKRIKTNWLRAFFDDEATVCKDKKRIRVKSMNHFGLQQVARLLGDIGIKTKITGQSCDRSWYLNVYRDDIEKYQKLVNFLHPEKNKKLEASVNYVKRSGLREI